MSTPEEEFERLLQGDVPTTPVAAPEVEFQQLMQGIGLAAPQAPAPVSDPFADLVQNVELESDRNDQVGFWPSLKAGVDNVYTSAVRVPAVMLADGVASAVGLVSPELELTIRNSEDPFFTSPKVEQAQLAEHLQEASKRPISKTLERLGRSEDWDTFSKTFMDSEEKWLVTKEVLGLSLPATLGVAAATMYGGLPGTFTSSFILDWGNSYVESRGAGKAHEEALTDATIKAATQAGIDTAAMGVAGVPLLGNRIANTIAQSTVQAFAGGGAEWLKHELVGEETTFGEIAIESLAEFALGPLEVFSRTQGLAKQKAGEEIRKLYEDKIRLSPKEMEASAALQQLERLEKTLGDLDTVAQEHPDYLEETFTSAAQDIEEFQARTDVGRDHDVRYVDSSGRETSLKESFPEPGKAYAAPDVRRRQDKIRSLEEDIAEMEAFGPVNPDLNIAYPTLLGMLQKEQGLLEFEQQVLPRAVSAINVLAERLGFQDNIVISTGGYIEDTDATNALTPWSKVAGFVHPLKGTSTWIMGLNPHYATNPDGTVMGDFLETVVHEFGHALMLGKLKKLDTQQKKAVFNAYRSWLKDIAENGINYQQFLDKTRGYFTATKRGERAGAKYITMGEMLARLGDPSYTMGMNEFLAHQFERMLNKPSEVQRAVLPLMKELAPELKQMHAIAKEDFNIQKDFKTFIQHLAANQLYTKLRKTLSTREAQRVEEHGVTMAADIIGKTVDGIYRGVPERFPGNLKGDLDNYNLAYKYGAGLTHLTKDNPHIKGLQRYTKTVKDWWGEKMKSVVSADTVLRNWTNYVGLFNKGKRGDRFARFILDLTVMSFDANKKFAPTSPEFARLVERHGVDEEGLALYTQIEQEFDTALNSLEEAVGAHIQNAHKDNAVEMRLALDEHAQDMQKLRNRNFFPLSRFGKHYVVERATRPVKIANVEYKAGDTISFTTYEKEKQALKHFKKNTTGVQRQKGILSDEGQTFAGMPPDLVRILTKRMDLTEEQTQELGMFMAEVAPGQSFKKHLLNRKQTAGFSQDAMRGFANYFTHFGNHIARIKYQSRMVKDWKTIVETVKVLPGDSSKRQRIADHVKKHMEYVLNPGNELANLRSLGFLWYLGFVPKSAVVNLTQVPLVTYPYLASRYGDAEAVSALSKAMTTFGKLWKNPDKVPPATISMLETLQQRGIIDESMATEMAAVSEGTVLQRFAPGWAQSPRAHRYIRTMASAGAYLFQQAEKANRRITAIAAFDLAMKRGFSFEGAIDKAEEAVEGSQYEYARWNRPFFAQKKRSVFFLFWQYRTNSLYFMLRDPGADRYLAMLFLMAGLSGLPFADDIMDLYDWFSKKMNKQFGEDTASIDVRTELREVMQELNANPDLMMHGTSRYLFGLPAVADMVGLPLPNLDMSGSLSMGRMVPGVGPLFGREGDYANTVSRSAEELGGAVPAIAFNIAKAIADDNPNTLKRVERALPSAVKNITKAYRYATEGDQLRTGAELVPFDIRDPKERIEIIMQAAGFAPTRGQVEKEKYWITKEFVEYYNTRRTLLLQDLDYTRRNDDADGEEEVRRRITEYNKQVPVVGLRISPQDRVRSLKQRVRGRKRVESGQFTPDRARAVQQRIDRSFAEPSEPQEPQDDTIIFEEILK